MPNGPALNGGLAKSMAEESQDPCEKRDSLISVLGRIKSGSMDPSASALSNVIEASRGRDVGDVGTTGCFGDCSNPGLGVRGWKNKSTGDSAAFSIDPSYSKASCVESREGIDCESRSLVEKWSKETSSEVAGAEGMVFKLEDAERPSWLP